MHPHNFYTVSEILFLLCFEGNNVCVLPNNIMSCMARTGIIDPLLYCCYFMHCCPLSKVSCVPFCVSHSFDLYNICDRILEVLLIVIFAKYNYNYFLDMAIIFYVFVVAKSQATSMVLFSKRSNDVIRCGHSRNRAHMHPRTRMKVQTRNRNMFQFITITCVFLQKILL